MFVAHFTVFVAFATNGALPGYAEGNHRSESGFTTAEEVAKYRAAAWAHFRKRCNEMASENIRRTIPNVEAVYLMKPRKKATESQLGDQYWMGDPYGYSSYEVLNEPGAYLYGRSGKTISGARFSPIVGYRYVEVENAKYREGQDEGRYLRYQLEDVVVINSVTKQPEQRREPRAKGVDSLLSRYGITWEDISTLEDRRFWVAGGKLEVVDLRTGEVLASRTGYVIDPQFGNSRQGRRAWLAVSTIADAYCPRFEMRAHRNVEFVARVLVAPKGE